MTEGDRPIYQRVMFYTVEVGGLTFETNDRDDAQRLAQLITRSRVTGADGLNLVAWPGRNDGQGGPPTGLILDQQTWVDDE
jgi:hypothetical protein